MISTDKRGFKPVIGYARESTRLEDLTEAHLEFIKLNWENSYLTLARLCQGIKTYKGIIRPGDLKRIAVRLALPRRPRPKTGEKMW